MSKRTIEADGLDALPGREAMPQDELYVKILEWLRSSRALEVVCGGCETVHDFRETLQDVIRRAQEVLSEVPDE